MSALRFRELLLELTVVAVLVSFDLACGDVAEVEFAGVIWSMKKL